MVPNTDCQTHELTQYQPCKTPRVHYKKKNPQYYHLQDKFPTLHKCQWTQQQKWRQNKFFKFSDEKVSVRSAPCCGNSTKKCKSNVFFLYGFVENITHTFVYVFTIMNDVKFLKVFDFTRCFTIPQPVSAKNYFLSVWIMCYH